MTDDEIRAALVRYVSNLENQEIANQVYDELYHDDAVLEFPQGGERLVGLANIRAMREAYPAEVALTVTRVRGGGDLWVLEVMVTYDGGTPSHGVNIMEFREGKVARETIYWGESWQPPAWRAPWVERMAAATAASA